MSKLHTIYTVTAKKEKGEYVAYVHVSTLDKSIYSPNCDYRRMRVLDANACLIGFKTKNNALGYGRTWARDEFKEQIEDGTIKEVMFLGINIY